MSNCRYCDEELYPSTDPQFAFATLPDGDGGFYCPPAMGGEHEPRTNAYGLNVDGDGNVVGIWFAPGTIERDDNDYWFVTADALERLAAEARRV